MIARLKAVRTAAVRITLAPVLVRLGVFLVTFAGLLLSYPVQMLQGPTLGALAVVAVAPALSPHRFWPSFAALVTVAGWVLATDLHERPIALWRLLTVAALLYLAHTVTALAALLPYDAAVDPDLIVRWLTRAGVVVLATSVLGVLLVELARVGGDGTGRIPVTIAGLLVVTGLTAMLAWLLRRR
ncbi:hypothetical protein ABZ738_07570 [Micromonospora sp. NPDC047793]|uniref:hypothetical protein n=1 Tax=unclassified Micromonospora TaxID=2617518 RepID=UPI001034B882|nr:hypothetical protein [Verrucosispora sp. SN26_14.1]TBL28035.1 hypothetical protein EYA84_27565 [Verrucosispora sp. SN26_14.1]